jgi:hypothetical protein
MCSCCSPYVVGLSPLIGAFFVQKERSVNNSRGGIIGKTNRRNPMSAYREQAIEVIKDHPIYKTTQGLESAISEGDYLWIAKQLSFHDDPLANLLADLII